MINMIVYLKSDANPEELIHELMASKLIASASIDLNNDVHEKSESGYVKNTFTVLTMQTKSLLFREVCTMIESRFGSDTRILSVPIVSANAVFENYIRTNTKQI